MIERARLLSTLLFGLFFTLAMQAGSVSAGTLVQGKNSISGIVYGEARRPVADVYVELMDEMYRTVAQTKTNGAGRYVFSGLPEGYYKVKVLPYGTDYEEQVQEATIVNVSVVPGSGASSLYLDFHLKRKSSRNSVPAIAGTVFAQEVPDEAKKLYEAGVQALKEKRDKEGFENIKRSLEIFPSYHLALDRLGNEYLLRGYNEAAFILLAKAVEVNPKSFTSNFGLGIAQYRLNRFEEAARSLRQATSLSRESGEAHLWLGKALARLGRLPQAEEALNQANRLFQGRSAEVHWQLARLYNEQKRYNEAADELERFLKYEPDALDAQKIRQVIKLLREKARKN